MQNIVSNSVQPTTQPTVRQFAWTRNWHWLALGGIVLLAAVLRFANISEIGQANTYYTAATKSMLESWHNFFFVAAEPGGSVTLDKPPVAFWLQAISAYLLGVNGFAVVLPQILAGIASVVLLFHLVRRWFGNVPGLIAAFALAVTPVAIAVERNNTPDAILILTLLLATWAFIKATETRKLRWLLTGAALVGVGFNVKMLQAFLPLPALYALYFFGSHQGWWRKLAHLTLATLVLIPVALSWALIVDFIPADERPYVGSSTTNSEIELALGYNGVQRLLGNMRGGARRNDAAQNGITPPTPPIDNGQTAPNGNPQADGFGGVPGGPDGAPGGFGGPGGAGGQFGTGQAGVLRMFQSGLAAEVSWLLPFGLLLLVPMAASVGWQRRESALGRGLVLWGGWLVTCVVFFSIAGFFHQYYLVMLGAPLAAVVAMGIRWLWRLRATHPRRAASLLVVASAVTLAFQAYAIKTYYLTSASWLVIPVALGVIGVGFLLVSLWRSGNRWAQLSFAMLLAAMLIVPSVWSGLTTAYANTSSGLTQAYTGNRNNGRFGGQNRTADGNPNNGQFPGGPGGLEGERVNQNVLNYLQANTKDVKYLVVVPSSMVGTGYVLATGRPVLYAGGFSGSDPVINGDSLAKLVANGDVRFVLWGGGGGPGGGNSSVTSYLQSSCKVVTDASLGTATSTTTQNGDGRGGFGGRGGQSTLYRCGS